MDTENPENMAPLMADAWEAARSGELDRAFDLAESVLAGNLPTDTGPTDTGPTEPQAGDGAESEDRSQDGRAVVEAYSKFALIVFGKGDHEASLRVAKRLREIQERVLGRDHVDVFATRTVIVSITAQIGQFDEALGLAARLLTDQLRVQGADHPETLRTRSTLAFLNAQKGDLVLAVQLYGQLLEDQRRVLGDDDNAVRSTHHELAFARIQQALLTAPDKDPDDSGGEPALPELDEDPEVALDQLVDDFVLRVAIHGRRHREVLALRSLLSQVFDAVGDFLHAYVLALGLLEDQREIQGVDHPDLFQLRLVVGDLMSRVGDVDGALGQLTSLLDDQRRVLGDDHPATIATHHRIISLSVALGGRIVDGAMIPEASRQPTSVSAPERFEGRLQAAIELAEAGKTVEAITRALALLDSQLGLLGSDHPDTRKTSGMLSGWISAVGGFDALPAALAELLATHQGESTVVESDVIDTRRALVVVATMGISTETDDQDSEIETLAGLLDDMVPVYDPDHPDVLVVRDQLAEIAGTLDATGQDATGHDATDPDGSEQGNADQVGIDRVVGVLQTLMEAQSEKLGGTHPETLRTRNLVADMTARTGDIEEALDRFAEVLADQRRVLGPDHPDTLVTRWNIASWMGETGDLGHAIPLMQALADDQIRLLGPQDPASLETRHMVAVWLARTGQSELAVKRFEDLLDAQREVLGDDHSEVERTRSILADLKSDT